MQRPEEPSEWAGLPSEPIRRKSGAELLPDEPPAADPAGALFGASGISSVGIPVVVPGSDAGAIGAAADEGGPAVKDAPDDPASI